MLTPRQLVQIGGVGAAVFALSWWLGADNAYLYPVSLLESRLGSLPARTTARCAPIVAAHSAYSQAGRFPDASREALDAAVEDGITHIEIDVSMFPWGPALYHAILPDVATAETVARDAVTLADFFATYAARFDLIFFDIKNVLVSDAEALESLRGFPWDPDKHIVIGRRCPLLRDIRHAFDLEAGCEMHGVLGNWLMGFEIWSVRDTEIRSFQLWLNRALELPLLTWTLPARSDLQTICHLDPEWVLVDVM